jgi:hypothetical protein
MSKIIPNLILRVFTSGGSGSENPDYTICDTQSMKEGVRSMKARTRRIPVMACHTVKLIAVRY